MTVGKFCRPAFLLTLFQKGWLEKMDDDARARPDEFGVSMLPRGWIARRVVLPGILASLVFVPEALAGCPVAGERPMLVVTLYFGESISGGGYVTSKQWNDFTTRTITPAFPDGFTVTDGSGQWLDPKTGGTDYDPTKVLTVALPESAGLPATVLRVMKAYEARFAQEAVGVTSSEVCAGFDQ